MYGNGANPGIGVKAATGGGVLAMSGAPQVMWFLAAAALLIAAGALAMRHRRLEAYRADGR